MVGFSKTIQGSSSGLAVSKLNERLPLGVSLSLYFFFPDSSDNCEPEKIKTTKTRRSKLFHVSTEEVCQSIPTDHISQRAVRWLLSKAALPLPTM